MSKKNKIAFGKLNLLRNDKLENNNYYEWNEQNQKWNLVERKID